MIFEINTESKSVTIKSFGHTFKEIKDELKKVLGKDWEDYKLYVDNAVTYIPALPQPYYPVWYDNSPCYQTSFIVNNTPMTIRAGATNNP